MIIIIISGDYHIIIANLSATHRKSGGYTCSVLGSGIKICGGNNVKYFECINP